MKIYKVAKQSIKISTTQNDRVASFNIKTFGNKHSSENDTYSSPSVEELSQICVPFSIFFIKSV